MRGFSYQQRKILAEKKRFVWAITLYDIRNTPPRGHTKWSISRLLDPLYVEYVIHNSYVNRTTKTHNVEVRFLSDVAMTRALDILSEHFRKFRENGTPPK